MKQRLYFLLYLIPLLMTACSGNLVQDRPTVTTREASQTPFTLMTVIPRPSATQPATALEVCDIAPTSYIIIQERAQVTNNDERLYMRQGPGTQYRSIMLLEPGDLLLVLDGPVCSDQYTWFRVQFGNESGWVAEGDDEQYYIEPYLSG